MNSDIRNEKFERERLEKQTICKMITMGIDPMHQKFLNEKATRIVDDFMNLLCDWGFVVVTEEKPFESSEDAENNKWFKINKGLFDSNNQMKKQIRRMDWQSEEGQIVSAFSKKFLELGVESELSIESCGDDFMSV